MGQISDLKQEVVAALRADPHFYAVHLSGEFSGEARELPVRKATIAVGIDSVEAVPGGLGGYLGEAEGLSHTGSMALVTLRFDCYLPRTADVVGVHGLFESLAECLVDRFGVSKVWCEPAGADRQALATRLCAKASLKVWLGAAEELAGVGDIVIQRRSD